MGEADSSQRIGSLSISIASDSTKAISALEGLARSLEKIAGKSDGLKNVASSLDEIRKVTAKFDANAIGKLADALSQLGNLKMPNMAGFSKGMEALTNVSASELEGIANAVKSLSGMTKIPSTVGFANGIKALSEIPTEELTRTVSTVRELDGLNIQVKGMDSLANNLERISKLDMNTLKAALDEIAQAIARINESASDGGLREFVANLAAIARNAKSVATAVKQASNSTGATSPPTSLNSGKRFGADADYNENWGSSSEAIPLLNLEDIQQDWQAEVNAIETLLNGLTKKVTDSISTIANAWKKSKTYTSSLSVQFNGLTTAIGGVAGGVLGLAEAIAGFVSGNPLLIFAGLKRTFSGLQTIIQGVVSATVAMMHSMLRMTASVSTTPFRIMGSMLSEATDRLKSFAKAAADKALRSLPSVIASVATPLQTLNKGISSLTDKLMSAMGLSSGLSERVTKTFSSLLTSFAKVVKFRIMRVIITEIFNGISTGMKNLYYYGGQFATTMDTLSTEMLYLKNSIAAMVAPALNALVPLIEYCVDKFVDFINVINMLIATLTGASSWTKALHYPTSYADALDDASSSAKELENTLMGFDEINKLSDPSSGSSGSGTSASDYSSMFSTEEIDFGQTGWGIAVLHLIQQIKACVANSDWRGVGTAIAGGINTALDIVDWWIDSSVKPQGVKWGNRIVNILNGAIAALHWDKLGKTVADGLGAITSTMSTFFWQFDGQSLGAGIGAAITSFFKNLDAKSLGSAIVGYINSGIRISAGLVKNLNFSTVANKIIQVLQYAINNVNVSMAVTTLTSLFTGIVDAGIELLNFDFAGLATKLGNSINLALSEYQNGHSGDIGTIVAKGVSAGLGMVTSFLDTGAIKNIAGQIATEINTAIKATDWQNVGKSIANMLTSACGTAITFMGNIDWYNLGTSIADSLKSFVDSGGLSKVGATLAAAMNSFIDIITGFADGMTANDWKNLGNSLGNALKNFLNQVDWGQFGITLNGLASSLMDSLRTALIDTGLISELVSDVSDFMQGLDYVSLLGKAADMIGAGVLESIKSYITKNLKKIVFKGFINAFKIAFGIHSPASNPEVVSLGENIIAGIFNGITNWMGGVKTWVSTNIISKVQGAIDSLSNVTLPIKDYLANTAQTLWDKFSNSWGGSRVVSVANTLKNTASTLWSQFSTSWGGSRIVSVVNNLKNTASDLWSKFSSGWGSSKNVNVTPTLTTTGQALAQSIVSGFGTPTVAISATVGSTIKMKDLVDKDALKIEILNAENKHSVGTFVARPMARGGIIDAATLFPGGILAGEAGTEAIVPLENHTEWLDKVAERIAQKSSSGGNGTSQPITIQVYPQLDGKTIGQCVVTYVNGQTRSTGVSPLYI